MGGCVPASSQNKSTVEKGAEILQITIHIRTTIYGTGLNILTINDEGSNVSDFTMSEIVQVDIGKGGMNEPRTELSNLKFHLTHLQQSHSNSLTTKDAYTKRRKLEGTFTSLKGIQDIKCYTKEVENTVLDIKDVAAPLVSPLATSTSFT